MHDNAYLMYTLADRFQFENLSRRAPGNEYSGVLRSLIPEGWKTRNQGVWTEVHLTSNEGIAAGWKIHLSVSTKDAKKMIESAVPILIELGLSFKICTDRKMHELIHNKNWPRSQIGKFITVYPATETHFRVALERIHGATGHLSGPYILSDRNYKSSKCLFYRYGAHGFDFRLDADGHRVGGFHQHDGRWRDDLREPGTYNPLDMNVDFDDPVDEAEAPQSILLHNRFLITSVIRFSGVGGMYFGNDELLDSPVVVRENRASLGGLAGVDDLPMCFPMISEALILSKLSATGLTPRFVDCFEEQSHWFLVQERLDGFETIWGAAMNLYFSEEKTTSSDTFILLRDLILRIGASIEIIHSHNVVMRDLTKTNVLANDKGDIRFIDFEFAYDLLAERPYVNGWTSGYASSDQRSHALPCFEDDCYAFGVLILDLITFSSSGYDLSRDGILAKLRSNLFDLGFPGEMETLVLGLTAEEKNNRWTIPQAIEFLANTECHDDVRTPLPTMARSQGASAEKMHQPIIDGLCAYLSASLDLTRDDRLWPSSPDIWATNPVSIKFGASGTAYFLLHASGSVDGDIVDWIIAKTDPKSCPPGLYSGIAGVACFLLDAGRLQAARASMDMALLPTALAALPHGFSTGSAGVGTAALIHFGKTKAPEYLEAAVGIARDLISSAVRSSAGLCWKDEDKTPLGFAYGASGVALFLLQCGVMSDDATLIAAARQAIDYDVSFGVNRGGKLLWRHFAESRQTEPHTPHVLAGTAGVGMVALRVWAVTGDVSYLDAARACAYSLVDRFTNKIWQLEGLAGIGEFIIDMNTYVPGWHPEGREIARHLADGVIPYAIHNIRNGELPGVTFAGLDHFKLCADYGYGAAGVGIFLERLISSRGRLFMMDDLLLPLAKRWHPWA